jgi:hypothetical protein
LTKIFDSFKGTVQSKGHDARTKSVRDADEVNCYLAEITEPGEPVGEDRVHGLDLPREAHLCKQRIFLSNKRRTS